MKIPKNPISISEQGLGAVPEKLPAILSPSLLHVDRKCEWHRGDKLHHWYGRLFAGILIYEFNDQRPVIGHHSQSLLSIIKTIDPLLLLGRHIWLHGNEN